MLVDSLGHENTARGELVKLPMERGERGARLGFGFREYVRVRVIYRRGRQEFPSTLALDFFLFLKSLFFFR